MRDTNLFLRIDFAEGSRLGPGKVALLEVVARTGSIAAAARELGMGYRTAWLLIDSLNSMFAEPVVTTLPGRRDGGSEVTDFGKTVIGSFHRMEDLARAAIRDEITALRRKLT
jgi:molybdate transport system regulatory protein